MPYTIEEIFVIDEPLESDLIVRQSSANTIEKCAGQMIEQEDTLSVFSEPLVFGSTSHYCMSLLSGGADPLSIMNREKLREIMHHVLDTEYDVEDWRSLIADSDEEKFLDEQIGAVSSLWQSVKSMTATAEVVANEQVLYAVIGMLDDGRRVVLQGSPDLVVQDQGKIVTVDYKTSGRAWDESRAPFALQTTLYIALVYAAFELWTDEFRYYVYDRRKHETISHSVEDHTPADINGALQRAFTYGLQIDAGIFPFTPVKEQFFKYKRGWYCSPKYCRNWNWCPAKFLPDGVDESVEATVSW